MYYLDLFQLHKATTKELRIAVRTSLKRDEIMAEKLNNQHNQCFYCATDIGMDAHLDHLIPVYYGGENKRVNLVAACKPCNLTKMTGQIEITNPYTINDYLKLQEAYRKWKSKLRNAPNEQARRRLRRFQPKRVRLHGAYRADLFRKVA